MSPVPSLKTPHEGPVFDKVKVVLLHDRAFTIPKVTELMYSDRSGYRYQEGTIRAQFQPLLAMGVIRRVGRRNGQVLWARPDADVEVCPFAGMTIPDIVEQLIGELGPMRITEMVVVMKERGYRPAEKERQTAAVLLRAITRFSGRFVKGPGGRWACAEGIR